MADTTRLVFRTPLERRPPALGTLLERAWPEGTERGRERALEKGRVEVDGRVERRPGLEPEPGSRITTEVESELVDYDAPEATALERSERWVVADKPVGMPGELAPEDPMHPVYFLADRLGIDRETFTPVWPMPTTAGGPWLFGRTPADATDLRRRWQRGRLMVTWLVVVPRPEVSQGTLSSRDGHLIEYATATNRDQLTELQLTVSCKGESAAESGELPEALRTTLAEEGSPIVGDRRHGGFMAPGGLRLRLAALFDAETDLQYSWNAPEQWFPDEPTVPASEPADVDEEAPTDLEELDLPELTVRSEVLERIRSSGHPWIRSTDLAGRADRIRPGSLARIRGANDVLGPFAIADNRPGVAARLWSDSPLDAAAFDETVALRAEEAVAARADLIRDVAETDLFRLVHGEADGLPGIAVDRVGPVLRARIDGAAAYAFREELYEVLLEYDPTRLLLEVEPGKDTGRRTRVVHSGTNYLEAGQSLVVREAGWRFRANPWSDRPRVDPSHRTARAAAHEAADPEQFWCVVAAPSALIPVVLIGAGVDGVLAAADSEADWLRNALELNELPREPLATRSTDEIVDELVSGTPSYDGMCVDLDIGTHALGGDLEGGRERIAGASLDALVDGGSGIFLARSDLEGDEKNRAERVLERAASPRDLAIADSFAVDPPGDFPALPGFPEGTPFSAVRARIRRT